MQVGDIYNLVLVVGLTGVLTGVVLTVLGNLSGATGITGDASTGINATITAINAIPQTWLGLIITISVLAVILGLVLRSFGVGKGR